MKIAIIRQRYNPYGGAERFVERALGALVEEGAEVSLITRSWAGASSGGFRLVECDPPYSRWLGGRAARDRSFAMAAQQAMRDGAYDITQAHERIPGCTLFRAGDGVHAAWLRHRARALGALGRLGQSLSGFHRYVLGAERDLFAHPALRGVICNSRMVADEISDFYAVDRDRLAVIYNGVDTTVFHPDLADRYRLSTRAAAGIPPEVPVLLYVGSGFERKGVPGLLAAFAALPDSATRLVVVGADRKLKAARTQAAGFGLADRVVFTGPLQDVRPWYGAADAFVLPTLYDPCPNAVLEALASGLPVLTSTTCGAKEWIVEGRNGCVVDALDGEALADGLLRLLQLAAQPAARAAARGVAEALTLDAMAQRLLALYRRCR